MLKTLNKTPKTLEAYIFLNRQFLMCLLFQGETHFTHT